MSWLEARMTAAASRCQVKGAHFGEGPRTRGRGHRLRLSGRRDHAGVRRAARFQDPPHPRAPRAGCGASPPTATRAPRGRVGVCMATSGPGATNLVTGIANAYLDSVPMVAITGQVATSLMGTDAFQEVDIFGITMPIVKHSFLVRRAAELPRIVHEAFRHRAAQAAPVRCSSTCRRTSPTADGTMRVRARPAERRPCQDRPIPCSSSRARR